MPAGIFLLFLKLFSGKKSFWFTCAMERDELLSMNSQDSESNTLSPETDEISKEAESCAVCALQQITEKQKISRVVRCFNSRLFCQTYINSMITKMPQGLMHSFEPHRT